MWRHWRRRWLGRGFWDGEFAPLFATPPKEEWVALDFETTSLDPAKAEIVSIGAVRIQGNRLLTGEALSILMLGLYLAFILLIAFAPGWLGTPLSEGSSITRGIPVGIGLIVSAFVLTGIYVFRANGEFDELNQKILKGAQS